MFLITTTWCCYLAGRVPATRDIGLAEVGVEMDQIGYIVGNHGGDSERSSVPNIYAIGDVLQVVLRLMVPLKA